MRDGKEVWESILTDERAAKGDLKLTYRENAHTKQVFVTHAEPVLKPLVAFLISQDVLYPEAEPHAARFMDMRRAFLAPCGHGFNRLYFSADERGEGNGSLEEDYSTVRRSVGRQNESLVIASWEVTTDASRLRELAPCHVRMIGSYRHAFRALHDALRDLDKNRCKE